jgi:hypothetical protein
MMYSKTEGYFPGTEALPSYVFDQRHRPFPKWFPVKRVGKDHDPMAVGRDLYLLDGGSRRIMIRIGAVG